MDLEIQAGLQLHEGCQQLGLNLDDNILAQQIHYLGLLNKWNKAYNLTAVKGLNQQVSLHLLDSLSVLPFIEAANILDVGTGAGLPGIPLALALPERQFCLLDSNGKKIRFLRHVTFELGLDNVTLTQARMQAYQIEVDAAYDVILSRAVTRIDELLCDTEHLATADCQWIFLKGPQVMSELEAIPEPFLLETVEEMCIPGVDGTRMIVIVKRKVKS